jgi:4-amino-4-deoxy-L-arabinose transferase-like glycosyltransferase
VRHINDCLNHTFNAESRKHWPQMNTDDHRLKNWTYLCLSVSICGLFLFFYRLGDRDLWSSHEARAGQNAQSILDSGDWLQPRLFDGTPEMQKPPMYYWLVAASASIRGGNVDAWDVRLPSAFAAFGTMLLLLISFRARHIVAVGSALCLATMQHFTWIGRTGRIDVPLTFAVTAAVLGLRSKSRTANVGGYFAFALAGMLKGPIGAIIAIGILIADWWTRARNEEKSRSCWWGIPLILVLTVPWFVAIHLRTDGEFTRQFFWLHNLQRAAGGSETLATHPWWTYLARLAVDSLPWSPLLIVAVYFALRTDWLRQDDDARFGFVWFMSVAALLSLSRFKRADYLLPAYPGLAIVLGCLLERLSSFRARWLSPGVFAACGAAVLIWFLLLNTIVPQLDAERSKSAFAAQIRNVAPSPQQVLFFRVEDHLLSFHLGTPLNSFLEWENLDVWAGRAGQHYIVMPADCAAAWRQYITSGTLEEVLRYSDRTDRDRPRDLVLIRTHPHESIAAGNRTSAHPSAPGLARTDQRAAAGPQPIRGPDRDH